MLLSSRKAAASFARNRSQTGVCPKPFIRQDLKGTNKLLIASGNVVQWPALISAESTAAFAAEGDWRQAGQRAEAGAERTQALVAEAEADIGHAMILRQQQF